MGKLFKWGKPIIFIFILTFHPEVQSQTFTKITSPLNPIVTDQLESGGGCWVDVNNDGLLDLFVANGNLSNQNNSLYINLGNGDFAKVFTGSVVNDGGSSIGGTFGDYNEDGNPDLFVTNRNFFKNFLYSGNGDSIFTKITTGSIVTDSANSNSSGWVDIDNDGDLDLFVLNFQGEDFLYLNNGSPAYDFTKIDTASFLSGTGFSIVGGWADYNNDLKPDLFVGNGGAENDFIFTNSGNLSFTKTTLTDGRATLGVSWGDYDNDGDLDLYTSCFLGQNNQLYNNSGAPDYQMVRVDTGIISTDGGNSVGSGWGDVDNDGDLDLFIANDNNENNFLYINNGAPNYNFTKITSGPAVNDGGNSFGCVLGDYDNDGDLDIFVANRLNQNNFLYSNDGNSNKWITIKCKGTASGMSAIGTKVRLKAVINGVSVWQTREVPAQTGYNSQNLLLHFGLGDASLIDSIKVEWTSGTVTHFTGEALNRNITISEDGSVISISSNSSILPEEFSLYQNFPNPFNPETKIKFDLKKNGYVNLKIFDISGKEIRKIIDGEMQAGSYVYNFNASNLPTGVYFYNIHTNGYSETRKMMVVK